MAGITQLSFTAAAGATTLGLTLTTPVGWVAVGIAGAFTLFGTVIFVAHEVGKTARTRIKKRNAVYRDKKSR